MSTIQGSRTFLAVLLCLGLGSLSGASEKPLEALLPADVIGFVKVKEPGGALKSLLASDLMERIQKLDLYRAALQEEKLAEALERLEEFESDSGTKVLDLVDQLLGDGAIVGARLSFPPEVMGAVRARSASDLEKGLARIREVLASRGNALPESEKTDYQGYTLERIDKVVFCQMGDTFLASNTPRAVRDMIDLARAEEVGEKSLSRSEKFAEVFGGDGKKGEPLITAGVLPRFIPGFVDGIPREMDNFPASLLASGWTESLRESDRLHAKLRHDSRGLTLSVGSRPVRPEDTRKLESVFFPEQGAALDEREVRHLVSRGLAGLIHLRRDMASWWEIKEGFLNPKGERSLVEFNNVMNLFFGGRSFQDEVLPKFRHGVTLLARRVSFEELEQPPSPTLPGFAAIFRIEDAGTFGRSLQAGFQSVVGFINVTQAQEGKETAFLVETERVGPVKVFTAVGDLDAVTKGRRPGIEHNFSPSLAVVGDRVIIGSHREIAIHLVKELQVLGQQTATSLGAAPVDSLVLKASAIVELLELNRDVLATKMMFDEGIERDEAEGRLKAIFQALGLLDGLEARTSLEESSLNLRVRLELAPEKPVVRESL